MIRPLPKVTPATSRYVKAGEYGSLIYLNATRLFKHILRQQFTYLSRNFVIRIVNIDKNPPIAIFIIVVSGVNRCPFQLLRSYKRHEGNKRKIGQERSSPDYQFHRPTPWMQESVSWTKALLLSGIRAWIKQLLGHLVWKRIRWPMIFKLIFGASQYSTSKSPNQNETARWKFFTLLTVFTVLN